MEDINLVRLNFSPDSLLFLNISLGFIMFGVALSLKVSHFQALFKAPKPVLVGVFSQFLLLPAVTFGLVWLLAPMPGLALGMILVAACPGGNISNFLSLLVGGNAALSVSLTAIATILAIFMTPFNFAFWGGMVPGAESLLQEIQLDFVDMVQTVALLLGLPLILGMWVSHRFPHFTQKITRPISHLSILIFIGFVVIAFGKNYDFFLRYVSLIFLLVLAHNSIAFLTGYSVARIFGLNQANYRAITVETGIQNSGLGLILIFNFFDGMGGMAIIAAWWGIWHIISGLSLTLFWKKGKD